MICWQKAREIVKAVYVLTKRDGIKTDFSLKDQMRRAANSVMLNIAEGFCRKSHKEFKQFLAISLGSMAELETQLIISNNIGYIEQRELDDFLEKLDRIRNMIRSLSSKISHG